MYGLYYGQNNLEIWKNHAPSLQTPLQSSVIKKAQYWHQKKHTHRSMEEHTEPRNKSMHLWSINQRQGRQEYAVEKRQSLQ